MPTPHPCPSRHAPVQLGVFYQRVCVPVSDEGAAREADEALGVVLQLPGHLQGTELSKVPRLAVLPAPGIPPTDQGQRQGWKGAGRLTMTSPLVMCSEQPWHDSPWRAQ